MKLIQPNCRVQFTPEDIDFIVNVLHPKVKNADTLLTLLADEESRDLILDDETLFRAVLEDPKCLRISTHFYFYTLVRHVFRKSHLPERALADYVAELLADQERSCALVAATGDAELLKWAQLHADIIRRFGRFPHRNAVLGRSTTPEEQTFLNGGGFKG